MLERHEVFLSGLLLGVAVFFVFVCCIYWCFRTPIPGRSPSKIPSSRFNSTPSRATIRSSESEELMLVVVHSEPQEDNYSPKVTPKPSPLLSVSLGSSNYSPKTTPMLAAVVPSSNYSPKATPDPSPEHGLTEPSFNYSPKVTPERPPTYDETLLEQQRVLLAIRTSIASSTYSELSSEYHDEFHLTGLDKSDKDCRELSSTRSGSLEPTCQEVALAPLANILETNLDEDEDDVVYL